MAGKKKKKPAANPARGFATVSQPSRARETVQSDDEAPSQKQTSATTTPSGKNQLALGDRIVPMSSNNDEAKSIEKMTPAELEAYFEDAELQNLVEKHASRVRVDATRQVSKLKNERRQLRQQADRAAVSGMTDALIVEVLRNSHARPQSTKSTSDLRTPELEESEVLLRLWLLHKILGQLKITPVDEALSHVLRTWRQYGVETIQNGVWGLEEALIWYAGTGEVDDSPNYDPDQTVETDNTDQITIPGEFYDNLQDANSQDVVETETGNQAKALGDTVPAVEIYSSSSDNEDDDPDDLVDRWLRLRTKLFNERQTGRDLDHNNLRSGTRKLTEKIKSIERDVLFDTDSAQQRWEVVSRDLEIESGRARKNVARPVTTSLDRTTSEGSTLSATEEDALLGDIFDGEDGGSESQLVDGTTETSMYHDFGSWTGINPQRLLEEACANLTTRNGLRFRSIHTTSFSSRIQLVLSFTRTVELDESSVKCIPKGISCERGPRWLSLKMIATTTKNKSQSEAYLATIAMFLLIAVDAISAKITPRTPKVWKEVLNHLERSLSEAIFEEDTNDLKHLRSIVRMSTGVDEVSSERPDNGRTLGAMNTSGGRNKAASRDHSDVAIEKWSQRARSAQFAMMQPARHSLPVYAFKSDILRAFHGNPILIICADTGAGKSTQIPSYILEDELKSGQDYRIMVTQPRRISAISIARRVSSELGEDKEALGTARSLVGYAIRMESKISNATRITFATTGVLLRMLQESPNLDHLDCLVLDEVHERTMDLDLLFIALKRLRMRRASLKIVLMSATVDATKFSAYFDDAPVLDIPGRTFPVQLGFLEDAIEATLDVTDSGLGPDNVPDDEDAADSDELEPVNHINTGMEHYSSSTRRILSQYNHARLDYGLILKLTVAIATKPAFADYSKAVLIFVPGISEIRRLHNILLSTKTFSRGWILHMLHSSFSTQELERAFQLPPPGCRKIVIATNIAETGITIPDITAVIDTCKEKIMRFDERRQISRLTEGFIARASARQRKGRAARVQNGLCFHLVTRHHFESRLQEQPTPEMLRLSLQDPILRVKVWDLGPAEEILLAALDPPSAKNIHRALSKLQDVGALDSSERLTALGKNLAKLPLDVAMGKMAILGVFLQSLDAIVTIIASFSSKPIYVNDSAARTPADSSFARGDSDLLTVYNAYSGWKKACVQGTGQHFCQKYHLNQFTLRQLEEQKIQLLVYLVDAGLLALSPDEHAALQRARNSRSNQDNFEVPSRYNRLGSDTIVNAIVAMAFYPKLLRREGRGYRNVYSNQQLQIAPTSVNKASSKPPDWLCYLEATQAKSGRLNAFHSSKVTQAMLALLLGQADFKFFAGVIDIDHGRIRLSLRKWKELLALQHLRRQVHRLIKEFLTKPQSLLDPADQAWLETMASALDGSFQSGVHQPGRRVQT